MQEKIRRENKIKVNMAIVKELKRYQSEINNTLTGNARRCHLHPKVDLEPCKSCPFPRRVKCIFYKRERAYILSTDTSYSTSKRRHRQNDKKKAKNLHMASYEVDEVEDVYENSEDDGEVIKSEYPCEEFSFTCPDKETCNKGQFCPWKE